MNSDQQKRAVELLEQTADNCSRSGTQYGPGCCSMKFGFRCRHCDQFGQTPPTIAHSPTCLITRIQSFLLSLQ